MTNNTTAFLTDSIKDNKMKIVYYITQILMSVAMLAAFLFGCLTIVTLLGAFDSPEASMAFFNEDRETAIWIDRILGALVWGTSFCFSSILFCVAFLSAAKATETLEKGK